MAERMLSLLNTFFCCCVRQKPDEGESEGERRPLLVDNDGTPIYVPRDSLVNDRQRVKDRLSNIVQDKQRKMINIVDHLPSNPISQRDVASTSTSRLRAASPSPHPSIGTMETESTSRSSSSAKISGNHSVSKNLVLNVRLIRGRDPNYRGNASRGRLGRFGEEHGIEIHTTTGVESSSDPSVSKGGLNTETQGQCIQPLNDEDRRAILHISNVIKQQLDEGWKIEDSGPIARGWGD